jgi:hypothetical protein
MLEHSVLICARGGGFGHAARGRELQKRLQAEGLGSLLLIRPGAEACWRETGFPFEARPVCPGDERRFATLIMDTFPAGWNGELSPELLASFRRKLLVTRYCRGADPSSWGGAYDRLLNPYPEHFDEWEPSLPVSRSISIGWLVRKPPFAFRFEPGHWCVLDPERRLGDPQRTLFARLANRGGYRLRLIGELPLAPDALQFEKLLCVGAGYNLFYELLGMPGDIRFLPVRKRWDDQVRRTRLFRNGIDRLEALEEWLSSRLRTGVVSSLLGLSPCGPELGPEEDPVLGGNRQREIGRLL